VVSDIETAWAQLVAARQPVERMESTLLERARKGREIAQVPPRGDPAWPASRQ